MKKWVIILILFLSGLLGFLFSLYQYHTPDVQEIQTFHYPATFVKQLAGDPDAGRKIFTEFCGACHANVPRIDIHAPRLGDKKFWKIKRQQGVDILLKITTQGIGAMPARGGCFECNDDQLRAAIQYILDQP